MECGSANLQSHSQQPRSEATSSRNKNFFNGHKHHSKRKPPKDKVAFTLDALEVACAIMKQMPEGPSDRETMDKTVCVMDQLQHAVNVLMAELGEEDARTAHAMYMLAESLRRLYYQIPDFDVSARLREASRNFAQRQESALEVDSQSGASSKSGSSLSASERELDFDDEDLTLTCDPLEEPEIAPVTYALGSSLPVSRPVMLYRSTEWFYKAKKVYEGRHVHKLNTAQEVFRLADIHTKLAEFASEESSLDVAVAHLGRALYFLEAVSDSVKGRQTRAAVTYLLSKFTYAKALDLTQKAVNEVLQLQSESSDEEQGSHLAEDLNELIGQLACGYVAKTGNLDVVEALRLARTWTATQKNQMKENIVVKGPNGTRPGSSGTNGNLVGSPDEETEIVTRTPAPQLHVAPSTKSGPVTPEISPLSVDLFDFFCGILGDFRHSKDVPALDRYWDALSCRPQH